MRTKSGSVSQGLLEEHRRGVFNDVSHPAQAVKGKQMFMHHRIINGFDFERYLGTGPNEAERPGDCKLILVHSTCSRFHNNPGGHSWRKPMMDEHKESARVCVGGCECVCVWDATFLQKNTLHQHRKESCVRDVLNTRPPKQLPVKRNTTIVVLNVALFVKAVLLGSPTACLCNQSGADLAERQAAVMGIGMPSHLQQFCK